MIDPFYEQTEVLAPEDIADSVAYIVTRPRSKPGRRFRGHYSPAQWRIGVETASPPSATTTVGA